MTLSAASSKRSFLLTSVMVNRTVRMEDVVYTLNNIMDDIDRMYADPISPEDIHIRAPYVLLRNSPQFN